MLYITPKFTNVYTVECITAVHLVPRRLPLAMQNSFHNLFSLIENIEIENKTVLIDLNYAFHSINLAVRSMIYCLRPLIRSIRSLSKTIPRLLYKILLH